MKTLAGARILVVEDEFLIASMLAEMLAEVGARVVGPAYNMQDGMRLAEQEPIDAGVLDVNLNGECSDAIAAALTARAIPFVLATGYGAGGASAGDAPVLDKPYSAAKLTAALLGVLAKVRH
jgi:DNA-binding response OmpR family regulator